MEKRWGGLSSPRVHPFLSSSCCSSPHKIQYKRPFSGGHFNCHINERQCCSTGLSTRAAGGTTSLQQSYRMLQQPIAYSQLHGCAFTALVPPSIFPVAFARRTITLQGCSEWPSSAPVAEIPAPARRKTFPSVASSRCWLQQLLKQPLHTVTALSPS